MHGIFLIWRTFFFFAILAKDTMHAFLEGASLNTIENMFSCLCIVYTCPCEVGCMNVKPLTTNCISISVSLSERISLLFVESHVLC